METEIKAELENKEVTSVLLSQQNELLRRNIEISEEILEKTRYIKNYIKWQKVWGVAKVLIIIIPLIIGFLYLPPLIKDYFDQFSSLYK